MKINSKNNDYIELKLNENLGALKHHDFKRALNPCKYINDDGVNDHKGHPSILEKVKNHISKFRPYNILRFAVDREFVYIDNSSLCGKRANLAANLILTWPWAPRGLQMELHKRSKSHLG